jgi:hypothetical protein
MLGLQFLCQECVSLILSFALCPHDVLIFHSPVPRGAPIVGDKTQDVNRKSRRLCELSALLGCQIVVVLASEGGAPRS